VEWGADPRSHGIGRRSVLATTCSQAY